MKGVSDIEEYSVYMHTNKTNEKKYIGITAQVPESRWGTGGRNYRNKCPHFWNAIQKYGWDNFTHSIVATGLSKEDACQMEIDLIRTYKTQNREFGYNTMAGGVAPSIPEEVRKKMSQSMIGNKNGIGHPCSEEKKKKISDAQKGRRLSDDHRDKLSRAKAGKTHAPPSIETRKKISNSHKKTPVYCIETDTVYESIQECARQLGVTATGVCACCKGKHKVIKGYHVQYYT